MSSRKVMSAAKDGPRVAEKAADADLGSRNCGRKPGVAESRSLDLSRAAGRPSGSVSGKGLEEIWDLFCKHNPRRIKAFIESVERRMIVRALGRVYGNQREASRLLGIKITTLNAKIKKYGIVLERNHRPPAGWSSIVR